MIQSEHRLEAKFSRSGDGATTTSRKFNASRTGPRRCFAMDTFQSASTIAARLEPVSDSVSIDGVSSRLAVCSVSASSCGDCGCQTLASRYHARYEGRSNSRSAGICYSPARETKECAACDKEVFTGTRVGYIRLVAAYGFTTNQQCASLNSGSAGRSAPHAS